MPCLIRDHNKALREFIQKHEPDAIDRNAEMTLVDKAYADGMDRYAQEYHDLADPVWEEHYLHAGRG